jgi:RNA polymerase sigma-70 factor (ECF subfamily)
MGTPMDPLSDETRFMDVFQACHQPVLAYVRRRVADDAAQDIVAETFLAAWHHLEKIPNPPLPWLYRAASFEVGHFRRQLDQDRRLWLLATSQRDLDDPTDPSEEVAHFDNWRRAFSLLSESDREVLRLVAWEGLTPADGALVVGCSTVAFKVRLHRARHRLVRSLDARRDAHAAVSVLAAVSDVSPAGAPRIRAALAADLAPAFPEEEPRQ